MSKRRTAADAFQLPESVKHFIDRGINSAADEAPERGQSPERQNATVNRRVVELPSDPSAETSPIARAASRGRQHLTTQAAPSADLTRTYAKATVQKTIRFHPRLIAELEAHLRQQELDGQKPLSFQQIQNEALQIWIEQYVYKSC